MSLGSVALPFALPTLALQGSWEAVDHARHVDWAVLLGSVCAWLLLALLVAFLVRAWATRGRYVGERVFDARDREILEAELKRIEGKTRARIAAVVVERSGDHTGADALAALATSLLATALCAGQLPWDDPPRLVLWQLVFGALGFGAARGLPAFRRLFVAERRATEAAERRALEEFYSLGLQDAPDGSGVLILVSLFERRAVVLGDRGAYERADREHWSKTTHSVLEGMRRGSLRVALAEAVRRVGETLRDEFPRPAGEPVDVPARVEVRSS